MSASYYSKRIICLANSRKPGGRCIAGKDWDDRASWIRPVSDTEKRSLSESDRHYEGGSEPILLDIISIPMLKPAPLPHQRENHLINSSFYWSKVGKASWTDIALFLESPVSLWANNSQSAGYVSNRVSESAANGKSLYLVKIASLAVIVGPKSSYEEKRVVKGRFIWAGEVYQLHITDPAIEREFILMKDGSYCIDDPTLCISLGDPFEGFCYKLIAGVIRRD